MKILLWIGSIGISLMILFYILYAIKVKLDINFNIGNQHFPQILENRTKGLVKCQWFANPHHCNNKVNL